MRTIWIIAVNEWKQLLREREAWFWIFIGPILFVTFFGLIMKPSGDRPLGLAVLNEDASPALAAELVRILRDDGVEVTEVDALPSNRRTIVVHDGTTAAIRAGTPVQLVLRTGEEESNRERTLHFKAVKALTRAFLSGLPEGGVEGSDDGGASTAEIRLVRGDIEMKQRGMTMGFQRSVPAYIVMFVFMNLLIGGSTIAEDRASGRLRRIALAPVSALQIVLGKLLSRFTIGWIQIIWLMLVGTLFFRIEWAQRNWLFFTFMTLFALSTAALGIFLGTLVRDPDKAIAIAIWGSIILSPLGGLWWPLEIVGPTMRKIAYFIPTGWAMQGVNTMLAFGAGPRELAPYMLAFAGLLAVTLPLAARRLRRLLGAPI